MCSGGRYPISCSAPGAPNDSTGKFWGRWGTSWRARRWRFLQLIAANVKPRTEPLPIVSDQQLVLISCPVRLLIGGQDVMLYPEEIRQRLKRNVSQVEEVYIAKTGHYLGDQSAAIDRFLERYG